MPRSQPSVFFKTISKNDFTPDPVYLLYGSEPGLVADAASRLKEKLIGRVGEEGYHRYTALGPGQDEASAGDVVAQLNTVSMFGSGKLVWLGPLGSVKKEDARTLAAYCLDPNPRSILIISVAGAKGDNRALASFEKSELAKAAQERGTVVKFAPPRGGDAARWAKARLESEGLSIRAEAAERLVELCDRDLDRISGEIDKLVSYVGDGKDVTMEEVESSVGDHRMSKIWDLTKAVRQRSMAEATAAMENLIENNQPPQMILKILITEIMRLASARFYRDRGESFDSFTSAMGGPAFTLRDAWSAAAGWPPERVLTGLRALLAANMAVMSKGGGAETVMLPLVIELCGNSSGMAKRKI